MKSFAKVFGIITLAVIIGFSACDDSSGGDGNDGGGLPPSSGTNEVVGKTLYLGGKIVFGTTGTTFKTYYNDGFDGHDELGSEGSYSYNGDSKTITLAIEYVYWLDGTKMNKTQVKNAAGKEFDEHIAWIRKIFDDIVLCYAVMEHPDWSCSWSIHFGLFGYGGGGSSSGGPPDPYGEDGFNVDALKQWLTQEGYNPNTLISQWKSANNSINTADKYINALLAEEGFKNLAEAKTVYVSNWVDEAFMTITYVYQFTTDGSLLVQEKLPANKGSNELSGKTFDYDGGYAEYTFTASGYTRTSNGYPPQTTETGTYAYDSTAKQVWLKPEKVYNYSSSTSELMTMFEYYAATSGNAESKASGTNSAFRVGGERYGLSPNWIGYYDGYDGYSIRLNRSLPITPVINPGKKGMYKGRTSLNEVVGK